MKFNIEDMWRDYEFRVLPSSAGPIQREETRRAFYAGFGSCFSSVVSVNKMTDSDGFAALDSMQDQLVAYLAAAKASAHKGEKQ